MDLYSYPRIIRYQSTDQKPITVKFSEDMDRLFFCTGNEYLIKDLKTRRQRNLDFLSGKTVRKVYTYGQREFMIVTAEESENFISYSCSDGNPGHNISIATNFVKDLV